MFYFSDSFSQLDHATGNAHYFKRFEKPLYSFFLLFFFILKSLPSNYKRDLTYKTLKALLELKKGTQHKTRWKWRSKCNEPTPAAQILQKPN